MFGGECDGSMNDAPTFLQPPRPFALGVDLRVDVAPVDSGTVYQQRPQVPIVLARKLSEAPLAAIRAVPGSKAEPGGKTPRVLDHVRIADRGHQHYRAPWCDRLDVHQLECRFVASAVARIFR